LARGNPKNIYLCDTSTAKRLKGREWWEGHVGKIKVDGNCINKNEGNKCQDLSDSKSTDEKKRNF
jgi:hypothetical protein